MTFKGIPASALAFYDALADDNTREFWAAHKSVYEADVRGPFIDMGLALADEFGPLELFRPYHDSRFAKATSPFKTSQGAIVLAAGGCGYYVSISADGLRTGGGYYAHDSAQIARYRAAIDDEDTGEELLSIIATLRRRGLCLAGTPLKSHPRGFGADHPRIELLRHRDVVVERCHGAPKWLHTSKAVDKVRADWTAVRPLNDWLAVHVGASGTGATRWRR